MAEGLQLRKLQEGVQAWNRWRKEHPEVKPDLSGANLSGANLAQVNLNRADLRSADFCLTNLRGAKLNWSDLRWANLTEANLSGALLKNARMQDANLRNANLSGANLSRSTLVRANLLFADLTGASLFKSRLIRTNFFKAHLDGADLGRSNCIEANFSRATLVNAQFYNADLTRTVLVNTDVSDATLTSCRIYGISVWNLQGDLKLQKELNICDVDEPAILVDNLEVAQFIYLLINYPKLGRVIDTITSKVVLILGRYTEERKPTLDAMRDALRYYDLVPVMFDFNRPLSKTLIETVSTLANLARFIIADFTDPKIVLQEAPEVVKNTSVALQPLLLNGAEKPATLLDLEASGRKTILPTFVYESDDHLIKSLKESIIKPVNDRVKQLIELKRQTYEEAEKRFKKED